MKELNNLDDLKKIIEIYDKMEENIKAYRELEKELSQARYGGYNIRGVEDKFLIEVYKKYDDKEVLNADGDLFYILGHDYKNNTYKCKRIRFDLELSDEIYTINEKISYYMDDDGEPEYDGRSFKITSVELKEGEDDSNGIE